MANAFLELTAAPNRRFHFHKSGQFFIRSHNEALSIALRIKNPDCSPFKATTFPRNLALAFTHYLSERPEMSQNKKTMMEGKIL